MIGAAATSGLGVRRSRIVAYGAALALIGMFPIVRVGLIRYGDWPIFANAGADAGSTALLHPVRAAAAFLYMPGAAWLLVPFSRLPVVAGFAVNAAIMAAALAAAAVVAAGVYRIAVAEALALIFAWAPSTAAIVGGQNAPLGLLLVLLSLAGALRGSAVLTAVPAGLLLYKPTYALPLFALFLVRRRWTECAIVAAIGLAWYAASAFAAGGDWLWPSAWYASVRGSFAFDFANNAQKAIGITTTLMRLHAPAIVVASVAACIIVPALRYAAKAAPAEAYAVACALLLNFSPHAWGYDAVLLLPLVFFAVNALPQRPRKIIVCGAYFIAAPNWLLYDILPFNPMTIDVIGGLALWLVLRGRFHSARTAATGDRPVFAASGG